jgi:hypothetical protein
MAEGQKFFRREIAVSELIREEDAHEGCNGKRAANESLLRSAEADGWHIAKDRRQPRAPDEEFQHHHQEEFESD